MNRETGRIYDENSLMRMLGAKSLEDAIKKAQALGKKIMPLDDRANEHLKAAMARKPPRVGKNDPCPCGSGKKYKRCCYIAEWKERYGK